MPTYEYECQRCRKVFEVFQSISAGPLKRCPDCRGGVRRLIGRGAGVLFKGSGFYQTDYRSSHYQKRAREESRPAESTAGKAGAATPAKDRKPAGAKE